MKIIPIPHTPYNQKKISVIKENDFFENFHKNHFPEVQSDRFRS